MLARFQNARRDYPAQFWLMFWGLLFSTSGTSMIWPYLLVYVGGKLDLPNTAIASLMTINAVCAVISSLLAGQIADKVGRKGVMVISLLSDGALFLLMIGADTYLAFAVILGLRGLSQPLYRVGADAMMADLIEPEKRLDAYSLLRMIQNAGISIGPVIGGWLATSSYSLAFICAAAGLGIYGLLLLFFAYETLPPVSERDPRMPRERWGGYGRVLRDWRFVSAIGTMAIGWVTASLMWITLPVYANEVFHVPESLYGWIPTTNALMVVFLQVLTTRITRRYPTLRMMALGMSLYTLSNLGVAFANNFWGFWACMVIMSLGELIIVPPSNTYVANLAPADMRGRYMSLYGLTWPFGNGTGPLLGGALNDAYGPRAAWFGGAAVGLLATLALVFMSLHPKSETSSSE